MMQKIALVGLFLIFTGCGKKDVPQKIKKHLLLDQQLTVNGKEREYHLYVPDKPSNRPIVVLLHGNSSNFDITIGRTHKKSPQKVWLSLAEKNNFIVAIPNGSLGPTNRRGWNDCRSDDKGHPKTDDVLFISRLLKEIKIDYHYDSSKVFIAGVSNGGLLALRLAQEIPKKITAFAAVMASMPKNTECVNSRVPISALFMNGTEDPIIPFEGGEVPGNGGTVKAVEKSVDYWIARDHTAEKPIEKNIPNTNENDDCLAKEFLYKNGTDNTEVAFYKIKNGGHTEPSISQRYRNLYLSVVGNQNGDFEMASIIWDFFKDKSNKKINSYEQK